MPVEFVAVKCADGALRTPTEHDTDEAKKLKIGTAYRLTAVTQSARSLRHHRLYWAGLIGLAMTYWQPSGGLITNAERKTLANFAAWLDKKGGNSGAVVRASEAFMYELEQSRAQRFEATTKDDNDLHEWIKREAGYVDRIDTPSGPIFKTRSINFNAMSQEEFNEFYKKAFSVVWRFILSRPFETEEEAQRAIDQLIAMG